jgi:SAM-dependent methyltransferase
MTTRMNFGCGSVQPDGWVNVDKLDPDLGWSWTDWADAPPVDGLHWIDIRPMEFHDPEACGGGPGGFPPSWEAAFDYIVANHSLSDLAHHELPAALAELHRVLKPGGVLRVLVPDLLGAVDAWSKGNEDWFPQDERTGDLSAKFCTFVTWYGTVGSVFTPGYLHSMLMPLFYVPSRKTEPTICDDPEIASLDGDRTTALIMEGRK